MPVRFERKACDCRQICQCGLANWRGVIAEITLLRTVRAMPETCTKVPQQNRCFGSERGVRLIEPGAVAV